MINVVAALTSIVTGYHQRIIKLEEEKYDHEMEVARRQLEVWPGLRTTQLISLFVWVAHANNVTSLKYCFVLAVDSLFIYFRS